MYIYIYILLRYCAGKRGVMNVAIDVHGGFSDGGSCDVARYCEYKFTQNLYLHQNSNNLHS